MAGDRTVQDATRAADVVPATRRFELRPILVLANRDGVPKMPGRSRTDTEIIENMDMWRIDDVW